MLFFSRDKKKQIGVKSLTLKDVREEKHVLLFKAFDDPEPHICLFAFTTKLIRNQDPNEKVTKYKEEMARLQSEKSDDSYAIANNKTLKYTCYMGHLRPKHIPLDYKSKRIDESTLIATIQNVASRFTKRHHGMLLSLIRSGIFGNGYEKMIPEDYIKFLGNHNISVCCSRTTLYSYINKDVDYLSFSFDIKRFNDDIPLLKETDNNKIKSYIKDIKFCSDIIEYYWQRIS